MGTYLTRTTADATSNTTATFSWWIKRSNIVNNDAQDGNYMWCTAGPGGFSDANWLGCKLKPNDTLTVQTWYGGTNVNTNRLFRDVAAWYHIVVRIDTSQSTAADRIRIYINGDQQTSFATATYPSQAHDYNCLGDAGAKHYVGCAISGSVGSPTPYDFTNGYMADFIFSSGYSYAPTSFGETDSTTGIWKPKTFTGSYGNNGFYLQFKNAGSLGTDTSGEGHNLTVNNAGTNAQVVDTPSNNFATFNPIEISGGTFSKGNLRHVTSGTDLDAAVSTIALTGAKWYAEFKAISKTGNYYNFGVCSNATNMNDNGVTYRSDGKIYQGGNQQQSSLATIADNDIVSVMYDTSNGNVTFKKNGTDVGSAVAIPDLTRSVFFKSGGNGGTNATAEANFGNPPFSISSGNSDANGFGNFEYAVPSGHFALCTKNLNTYG